MPGGRHHKPMNGEGRLLYHLRRWAFALAVTASIGLVDCLARLRLTRVADALSSCGAWLFGDLFRGQCAYIRSYAGDVAGALAILQEEFAEQDFEFLRYLHSGLICEHNGLRSRAAQFFQQAMASPQPVDVGPEYREWMGRHIHDLTEQARVSGGRDAG